MRAATPLIGWGLALAAFAAGLLVWSGSVRSPWILLACSAAATMVTGITVGALAARRRDGARAVPDISLSPTLTAFGVLLVLTAIAAGRWLVLVGLGITAVGIGGVLRELIAQRSAVRR
jgi:hypothetical protein